MIDQIFSTTVSSCTPSYISANNPPMVSSPCSSGAQAWIRNTLPCVFRSGSLCHACGCSASRAARAVRPCSFAIDLPLSRRESRSPRQIESGRRSSTGPAACSRECTAETRARISSNTLHPQSGLRQVGIIHNKHCRKMALLIVFPYVTALMR